MNLFSLFKGKPQTKGANEFGIDITPKKHAGQIVNTETAIAIDAVFACIRDKSESIGQLPVKVKRGKSVVESGRVRNIFAERPNDFQTMQEFIEMWIACLEARGNFYAEVVRNDLGNVSQIIPFMRQQNCQVNESNGRIYYTGVTNDGRVINDSVEILHDKQLSLNGYNGETALSRCAKTMGITMAQEDHLHKVMDEGAVMKGYLSTDQIFKDNGILDAMRKMWRTFMRNENKDGNTPILDQGMKFHNVTLSPADTELILQRKFSREQICGLMRVPISRIGGSDQSKAYNSVEENNIAYMRDSLIPHINRIETKMTSLMPTGYSFSLDEAGFVRGDRRSQIESLEKELKSGAISLNEFRLGAGREEIDGGDLHAIDTNNLTFGRIQDIPALQQANNTVNNDE